MALALQQKAVLLAIDAKTGKLAWIHPVSQFTSIRGLIASEGKVLLNSCSRSEQANCDRPHLQAVDAQSGKLLWNRPYSIAGGDNSVESSFILFQQGQLYIQGGNQLRSINPATGQQRWAIERPWHSLGFGLFVRPGEVTVVRRRQRQRLIQTLNPQSGAGLRQFTLAIPELSSTEDLIAINEQTLFLATSGLKPGADKKYYYDSGSSAITGYDLKTHQARFKTKITGTFDEMQTVQDSLFVSAQNPKSYSSLAVLESSSGKLLWQKSKPSFNCLTSGNMTAGPEAVYLYCLLPKNYSSAQIVAIRPTGELMWRSRTSNALETFLPLAVNDSVLVSFSKQNRTPQAVGLNPRTGKVLWTFALRSKDFLSLIHNGVALEGNRLFILDELPRWKIWRSAWNLAV